MKKLIFTAMLFTLGASTAFANVTVADDATDPVALRLAKELPTKVEFLCADTTVSITYFNEDRSPQGLYYNATLEMKTGDEILKTTAEGLGVDAEADPETRAYSILLANAAVRLYLKQPDCFALIRDS